MKRSYLFYIITLLIAMMTVGDALGAKPKKQQRRTRAKSSKVVKKKAKTKASKKNTKVIRAVAPKPVPDPRLNDPDYDPFLQCEDTCGHVHGIDLSRYQGDVFWETVGENTKMAYVYLKATEGGDRIDAEYDKPIDGETSSYERYRGSYVQDEMGYSDDDIDTIFDGDPDAYWNID